MSCLSILRIGPKASSDVSSVDLLRKAILEHYVADQEEGLLSIANRYFSATVAVAEVGAPPPSVAAAKEDGLILVFDNTSAVSACAFDTVQDLHQQHADKAGDLLRLCVGVSLSAPTTDHGENQKAHDDEYARRILWCLDRGYEYLPVDLSDNGRSIGHDDRDKEGFARLIEAISSTVWSSSVMAKKQQQELQSAYAEDKPRVDEEPNEYEPPPPLPNPVLGDEEDQERTEQARRAILEQSGIDAEKETKLDENSDPREDAHTERVFDQFESALREATRIRDLSRAGDLSDEDRRQRASDAAMLLMDLMGQMGLDEDDSEEEHPEEAIAAA